MAGIIDPETIPVNDLPAIWSPVQWELTEEERVRELEEQATASLIWMADAPEAILRLALGETEIERCDAPPENYQPDQQGEWNDTLLTFEFRRPIRLVNQARQRDRLIVTYQFGELGYWEFTIEPECMTLKRV